MPKSFSVGDRVRVTDAVTPKRYWAHDLKVGDTGYVKEIESVSEFNGFSTPYAVQFDRPEIEDGYPLWMSGDHLESVNTDESASQNDLWDVDPSLDPNDPFERVIIDIVTTNRRKRADYAIDGSPWSNFDDVANSLGIEGFAPVDSANFNIEQKSARLRSLRKNGRTDDPQNESVADTYLDRAVYSVIAYAMFRYPEGKVPE